MAEGNKLKYYRWSLGDRYDGWRVRNVDALFSVIPFILNSRTASQLFFEQKIPIDVIEDFIKKHKEEIPDLSLMHVIMAAHVRLISQRPQINRYVVWNKIFARNHVSLSIAVKREMSDQGEETVIKPGFLPTDTLQEVVRKTNEELLNNQQVGQENSADNISKLLGYLPDFLLRFVVEFLKILDKVGILPKFVYPVSPFHASLFVTNIGSLGIESIYHHLYEFGTCSMFCSMGKKTKEYKMDRYGVTKPEKSIILKFVLDERICDGFYYASSMRMLAKILANPAQLLEPPLNVIVDEGVGKKRIDL